MHGLGIDRPLSQINTSGVAVYPHVNWQGQPFTATAPNGDEYCSGGGAPCPIIDWAGLNRRTHFRRPEFERIGYDWYGSLITGGSDPSELLFMRSRYYDPESGAFTQPDPIGLAGGMNLYGYANGDPVNFWDPFGLCKITLRTTPVAKWGRHTVIVTEDPDGSTRAFRGGPEGDFPGFWGDIVTESAASWEESSDYGFTIEKDTQTLLDDDEPCDPWNTSFEGTMSQIPAMNARYDPLRQNSNSVTFTALARAGLGANKPAGWVPAWRPIFGGGGGR